MGLTDRLQSSHPGFAGSDEELLELMAKAYKEVKEGFGTP